ncbi:MAG: glycosyltransferase [Dongiaceae bacterium]
MTVTAPGDVKLSIIVPTFRRADRLERLLTSLEPQLAGRSDRELIVVDDASADPAYAALAVRFRDTMKLLTQPKNAGPAAARNAGFHASRGAFLVFTDDDCVAPPFWLDWLDTILAQNPDVDLIGGEARPLPHERAGTVTRWVPDGFLRLKTWSYLDVVTLCSSCIVAVRRTWFDRIGGFREAMRWAEDRNLTYRLRQAGAILYTDHAWHVYHESEATLRQHLRRRIGYGKGSFDQIVREQPAIDRCEWPDEGSFAGSLARRVAAELRRIPLYRREARKEKKWAPGYVAMAALTPLAMDWGYLRARQRHRRRRNGLGPNGAVCLIAEPASGGDLLGDLLAQNPGTGWARDIFEEAGFRGTEPVAYDLLPRQIARCEERAYGFAVDPARIAALGMSLDSFIERAAADGVANFIMLTRRNSLPRRIAVETATLRQKLRSYRSIELTFEDDIEPDPMIGLRKVVAFLDLPDYDPVIRLPRARA